MADCRDGQAIFDYFLKTSIRTKTSARLGRHFLYQMQYSSLESHFVMYPSQPHIICIGMYYCTYADVYATLAVKVKQYDDLKEKNKRAEADNITSNSGIVKKNY